MTLISEYAGYSRATIHKYFKNKDDAFRQVIHQFQQQANQACQPIMQQDLECWVGINLIMQAWLKPTFDEVSDQFVLNDLKFHVQQVAADLFQQARKGVEDMLCELINNAASQGNISLSLVALTPRKLAKLLLASLDGLRGHLEKDQLEQASHEVIRIYEVACHKT